MILEHLLSFFLRGNLHTQNELTLLNHLMLLSLRKKDTCHAMNHITRLLSISSCKRIKEMNAIKQKN